MPNRVLVTGGAGYIGSVVAAQLIARGDEVIIYDNLSNSSKNSAHPKATLVVADTSDREALERVFSTNKIDAVIHFAASIEAGKSMKLP
jgi:UDP-glucose 4-epimerase